MGTQIVVCVPLKLISDFKRRRPSTGGVGGGVPVEGLVGWQSSEGVGDGGSSLWRLPHVLLYGGDKQIANQKGRFFEKFYFFIRWAGFAHYLA